VEMLAGIKWLAGRRIFYWGDIDTHGFAMLSQVRGYWPQVHSLLMDRQTLMDHKELWGHETAAKRFAGTLAHLTRDEQQLFADLKANRIAPHLRLEQERIRYTLLLEALQYLPG